MKKTLTLAVLGVLLSLSHGSFATILGPSGVCVGGGNYLTDSAGTPGTGVWSSSNTAIVTITGAGYTHGVAPGTATISYVVGSVIETYPYTVYTAPAPITGSYSLCVGSTATLANSVPGGTWSSGSTSIATIGATSGTVTGVSAGTVWIYYTMGSGCYVTTMDTVISATPAAITGVATVCVGATTSLASATYGGTWSSSNTAVATVSGGVIVTGVAAGTATISYNYTNSCGTGHSTRVVTVNSTTAPGTISGSTSLSTGTTTTLTDSVAGGTWSSGNTSVATISASGVVTGVAPGTAVITYSVSGCGGIAYTTTTVTVTAANCISGTVFFMGSAYYGGVKIWLIKYNAATHMLYAVDSTYSYCMDSVANYQFCGMDTGTYRVKAATDSGTTFASGYVPTYHANSFYWNTATTFFHAAGTTDVNKNIDMGIGVATSGPGFIAGDVTMGANKGTAGDIPSVGLLMYAEDNATGAILQQTTTDAAGHYTFSNLPAGTYRVYPELINYTTVPYSAITLSAAYPSMIAASFVQHTLSHKITPVTTAVGNVSAASFISAYPNPTSGRLNVSWNTLATEQGNVTISDITGRNVYSATINMNHGAGTAVIDLSALTNGLYMISVKSATLSYNSKIQVQK